MTKTMTALVVVLSLLVHAGAAVAQEATPPPVTPVTVATKRFSTTLVWVGATTMLVGGLVMVPMDDSTSTTYAVQGVGRYCADTNTSNGNVSVTKGGCHELPAMVTAGLITMGIGGVLTLIGMHKVTVSPHVGHTAVGARVAVQW